ncbi:sensor histidine kinase [Salipaludibacillus sp. HK11]|uniref:sensor histidine kinase n=1 Tax=Salipaludibacillus sp. HK11 TaxID=3394320 RepID=UPI0039FCEB02
MRPSIKGFNNIKLRNKLIIMYIFCVFVPIILTNVIFYNVTIDNIKNQKEHDMDLVLEQITGEFISAVDQAIGISAAFYTDTRFYDFFETDYDTVIEYIENYEIYMRDYNNYTPLYYSIQGITFYTDNPSVIYAGGISPITEDTREYEWYKELAEVSHPILVNENEVFSVIRELDYYTNRDDMDIIVQIKLNPVHLRQIFNNVTFQGHVYLLNDDKEIEYSNNDTVNWQEDLIKFDEIEKGTDTIFLEEKQLPHNYLENWKVVGTVSEAEIYEELYHSRRFIITLASINFLFPTLIIIFISRSLHVRIARILRHMKKMKKQNFETIDYYGDKDEIGELTNEFNKMANTIKTLINEVYVANIQKKDLELKEKQAQLSALLSQINPHFLFNALETIRVRSLMKDETETAKIIQNMAKIFRNSLTWDKEWVTVREELNLIICFLEIQKYRFGDKLEYEFDIDDAAYDCLIPNMAFLPFVENASVHGIESVKEKGNIHIKIQCTDDEILFTIRDNGGGMSKDKLDDIMESLKNEESMGENVGIKNVYYRLQLYYKTEFDFNIESSLGNGTKVEIKLKSQRK